MSKPRINLVGQQIGHLKVVGRKDTKNKSGKRVTKWVCKCLAKGPACKKTVEVSASNITKGSATRSCGCLRRMAELITPPQGEREQSLEDRFGLDLIEAVRADRKLGDLYHYEKKITIEDGDIEFVEKSRRANFLSFFELGLRHGISEQDARDICRPLAPEVSSKRKKTLEHERWRRNVALLDNTKIDGKRPVSLCDNPHCGDCQDYGNPKTLNRRFARARDIFEGYGPPPKIDWWSPSLAEVTA